MNRKALKLATRMALRTKIDDGELVILDDYTIDAPKTKDFASVLKALKLDDVTTIFAIAEYNVNIYKSVRNIAGASVKPVAELNAYDILKPQRMLITKAALDAFRGKVAQEKN